MRMVEVLWYIRGSCAWYRYARNVHTITDSRNHGQWAMNMFHAFIITGSQVFFSSSSWYELYDVFLFSSILLFCYGED